MLGLSDKQAPKAKKSDKKQDTSAADEAKAMLAKMEAKKADGDCPFC